MRHNLRPAEAERILKENLEPEFAALESARRSCQAWLLGSTLGFMALVAVLQIGQFVHKGLVVPLAFLIACVGFDQARRRWTTFASSYKEKVIRKATQHFFPELAYAPERCVSKELYDESKLFRLALDGYEGNDHFQGQIGEVDFEFSELYCWYETQSKRQRQRHTVFRGFFFIGDFHREIRSRTTIEPDLAEGLLGVLGRGLQRMAAGNRLVDLEDTEFEKLFKVTADDQVEARYILTPVLMEKLRTLRQQVGCNIHLCFVNGKMFFAIATGRDYFEPSLWGPILSKEDLLAFVEILTTLLDVAQELLHHPKFAANPPALPKRKLPPLPMLAKKG